MRARRLSRTAAGALVAALVVSAASASAQPPPSPAPKGGIDQNAAIVLPLTEIGRVRARTPYCAALARARPGIDSALAYEYALPILAQDLARFRLDSYLTKHQSLTKTERDLSALWDLAIAGRTEVQALREAAEAPGVDEPKKREMVDFANALDGAKARQMMLAKSISRVVGTLAETEVRNLLNGPMDDHGASALRFRRDAPQSTSVADVASTAFTTTQADALTDRERTQNLFGAFVAEDYIRADLKNAAQHAIAAMQLGNCDRI